MILLNFEGHRRKLEILNIYQLCALNELRSMGRMWQSSIRIHSSLNAFYNLYDEWMPFSNLLFIPRVIAQPFSSDISRHTFFTFGTSMCAGLQVRQCEWIGTQAVMFTHTTSRPPNEEDSKIISHWSHILSSSAKMISTFSAIVLL